MVAATRRTVPAALKPCMNATPPPTCSLLALSELPSLSIPRVVPLRWFAQCGLCGQSASTTTRSGVRYYSCPTQPTGCGRIHVCADRLEAWLLDQLLEQLRLEAPPTAQDADLADIAKAMAELCRDYYVDRIVPRAAFLFARAVLVRRADELSRQTGRRPEAASVLAAANPRKQLGALDLGQLRDLLADRLERLVVNPMMKPRRGVFDPGRLRCEWRTPAQHRMS
jgi:hypothetical protein